MGVDERSDAELVHQTLEGDENAFQVLHGRYSAHVFAYAYNRTGDPDDAQTVVQDTFLKAYQNLEGLKDNGKVANWMFRIAFQLCAGMHRERRKQIEYISLSEVSRDAEPLEVAKVTALIEHQKTETRAEHLDLEERVLQVIA